MECVNVSDVRVVRRVFEGRRNEYEECWQKNETLKTLRSFVWRKRTTLSQNKKPVPVFLNNLQLPSQDNNAIAIDAKTSREAQQEWVESRQTSCQASEDAWYAKENELIQMINVGHEVFKIHTFKYKQRL